MKVGGRGEASAYRRGRGSTRDGRRSGRWKDVRGRKDCRRQLEGRPGPVAGRAIPAAALPGLLLEGPERDLVPGGLASEALQLLPERVQSRLGLGADPRLELTHDEGVVEVDVEDDLGKRQDSEGP